MTKLFSGFLEAQRLNRKTCSIKKNYPELLSIVKIKNKNEFKYYLERISRTLYEYSFLYKLVYRLSVKFELLESKEALKYLAKSEIYIQAALDNYEINLKKLFTLQKKFKFKVILLQPPYRDSVYNDFFIETYDAKNRIDPKFVKRFFDGLNKIRKKYESEDLIYINSYEILKNELNLHI